MSTETAFRPFISEDEVRRIVLRFEAGTIPLEQWDHRAHLAVAMWYVAHKPEVAATERFINGLRRFNHATGIAESRRGGYNETLTLFWLSVASRIRRLRPDASPLELVNLYLRMPKSLSSICYSDERLWSKEARSRWVAPDENACRRLELELKELTSEPDTGPE